MTAPCRILVAYPYLTPAIRDVLSATSVPVQMVLDSGAFTAWNTGKTIHLDDYCRTIERLNPKPWRYFNLDVIGDASASEGNLETMLRRGFKPVPVLTRGATASDMDAMFEVSDVVAVGGLTAIKGARKLGYIKRVMRWAAGRNVHLLGATSTKVIASARPYMCDSSSWVTSHAFGRMTVHVSGLTTASIKKNQVKDYARAIRSLGVEPKRLLSYDWSRSSRRQDIPTCLRGISARSVVRRAAYAHRNGVRLFAACADEKEIRYMLDAWEWLNA